MDSGLRTVIVALTIILTAFAVLTVFSGEVTAGFEQLTDNKDSSSCKALKTNYERCLSDEVPDRCSTGDWERECGGSEYTTDPSGNDETSGQVSEGYKEDGYNIRLESNGNTYEDYLVTVDQGVEEVEFRMVYDNPNADKEIWLEARPGSISNDYIIDREDNNECLGGSEDCTTEMVSVSVDSESLSLSTGINGTDTDHYIQGATKEFRIEEQ